MSRAVPLAMLLVLGAAMPLVARAAETAGAQSTIKPCLRTCRPMLRACLQQRAHVQRAARAVCTGSDRRPCLRTGKRVFKAAKRTCRRARAACRACCRERGTACDRAPEVPIFSGTFPLPDRRELEALPLPPGPDGRGFTLFALPDGVFHFDPAARSPVSAAAECAAAVLACYDPALRNWAGCFAAVPRCETRTPWVGDDPMCCATACGERYQEGRRRGLDGPRAFAAAIWNAPSCMPELPGREASTP